jgi:hypothetical protein
MVRICAQYLLAGRACDADFVIKAMAPDIRTKESELLISVFVRLEHWRGVATSCAWNASFLAAVQVQGMATVPSP